MSIFYFILGTMTAVIWPPQHTHVVVLAITTGTEATGGILTSMETEGTHLITVMEA